MSGLQLLQAPSGPWRTRHLRLRSHVLRERLRHHLWDVEHVPGVELCADLLTKSITQQSLWESFRRAVGLRTTASEAGEPVVPSVKKIAYAVMASLGLLAVVLGVDSTARVASLVGLAALAASTACGPFETAKGQSTKRSNASQSKEERRWSREDEPDPARLVREKELDIRQVGSVVDRRLDTCQLGTRASAPCPPWNSAELRLSAMKVPTTHRGLETDTPWELDRFATPPTGADRWERLGSGNGAGEWWVRVLKKKRVRAFHPLHRGTPFMIARMSTTRVSVVFSRESTRQQWRRRVVTDDWTESRNCDVENVYEWVGYSFFYVRFVSGDGQGLREEVEQRPATPGISIQRDRAGYGGADPLQSTAVERGAAAMARQDGFGLPPGLPGPVEVSARDIVEYEGGSGYAACLDGCIQRGEVQNTERAGDAPLALENLLPPEADSLPMWMCIEKSAERSERLNVSDSKLPFIWEFRTCPGAAVEEKTY